MKYAVVYSKKDEAGVNIAEQLRKMFLPQVNIIELAKETIESEDLEKEYAEILSGVDFIIFASRHQSKEIRKTLSLHAPGNWRNADYGGKSGKICNANALAMKFLFKKFEENAKLRNSDYELTLECTHHGPLIKTPCCFIELGTTSEQWKDKTPAEIVAKTIFDFQGFDNWLNELRKGKEKIKIALGIGGPHYCPTFNKIQLSQKSGIAIGHIIPQYAFPLSETMLFEAVEKSPGINLIVVDWKGCGNSESRQKIIELVEKSGINYERTEKIEKE